jgi:hypothetical protein
MGPASYALHSAIFWSLVLPLGMGLLTKSVWSSVSNEWKTGVRVGLVIVDLAVIIIGGEAAGRAGTVAGWTAFAVPLCCFCLGFVIIELLVSLAKGTGSVLKSILPSILLAVGAFAVAWALFGDHRYAGEMRDWTGQTIGLILVVVIFGSLIMSFAGSFKKKGGGKAHH